MKTDIENRSHIQLLIDSFYDKVRKDDIIGYIFNDVAQVDWPHHLPRMYDFWEDVVFQSGKFAGNPMTVHLQLHQRTSLKPEHFSRWLQLFTQTTDELFEGNNAALIKQRANSIAAIMQAKLSNK
jgi:hemoglobin